MDSVAGQPSPAPHHRGLASRFSAIRKAVSSRDLSASASPRSSSSSGGYDPSARTAAPEPRHGRRPSADYIPYTGPITQPPASLPVLPQPNVGPTLATSVEPFFGRKQPLSSRARSGSASSPFVGPSDPRAAPPWATSLIGGMTGDDSRFGKMFSSRSGAGGRVADQETPRTVSSAFPVPPARNDQGIAFPSTAARPSMGEGLPTAYSHFNYGYKAAESEPFMPASMRSDNAPVRPERSLIAGREFAPAGFTYRPAAQPRGAPVTTSQLYKPRSRDSNEQRMQTPPGRTSIRTMGSTGTMGGESSGSAMSTSTSMTSLQGTHSPHHKQISTSSLASSQRELRSAASVPNLKRTAHKQSDSAPPTLPSHSAERLPEAEKALPALPALNVKPLRTPLQKPALSPVAGSSILQGSTSLSQIDSNSSAGAQRRYFLLQQLHLDELAAHSPDTTGYLVPDNNCEKVFVPKPRLRHNSTDSKSSVSRDSQLVAKNKAAAAQALPVFERNRPVPPLVIVGRGRAASNPATSHSGARVTHAPGASVATLEVPHRDGSVRTSRAFPAADSQYVYDADTDAEMRHLRAQATQAEGTDADARPFFHHRMPPAPPPSEERGARARDSIVRPKTPKGGWGVLAHRQRTPSGNMLRAASQDRVLPEPATLVARPFSPSDEDLDVQTVLAQGAALDQERDAWRREHQRSIGASAAPSWARRDKSGDRSRTNSGRLGSRDFFTAPPRVDFRTQDDAHLDPRGGELARSSMLGFETSPASVRPGHARQLSAFQQGQQQHQRRLRQARSSPQLGSASYAAGAGRYDTPSPALPSGATCVPGWMISRPGLGLGLGESRNGFPRSASRERVPSTKMRTVRKKLSGRNLCGNNKKVRVCWQLMRMAVPGG